MSYPEMRELSLAKTDVLILVGGQGKRLRPLVGDRAKPMADVGGRPFLDLVIDHASAFGARRFILATGYQAKSISTYYERMHGSRQILISHETEPLGTAGAVKNAEGLLQSDPFLAMNGDSFCRVNLPAFLEFHLRKKAVASIALVPAEDTQDFGTVQLDGSQQVLRFEEKKIKKEQGFISAGIYLFDAGILGFIPTQTKCSLEYDVFPKLVGERFYGFVAKGEMIDIGTPERYQKAVRILGSAMISPSAV